MPGYMHKLTQISHSGLSHRVRLWPCSWVFQIWGGCPDSDGVLLVYYLPSPWKICAPGLTIARFRALESHLCRTAPHPQPGQAFPLAAEAGALGMLAGSINTSVTFLHWLLFRTMHVHRYGECSLVVVSTLNM